MNAQMRRQRNSGVHGSRWIDWNQWDFVLRDEQILKDGHDFVLRDEQEAYLEKKGEWDW